MTRTVLNKETRHVQSPLGRRILQLIKAANYDHIKDFEKDSGVRPDCIRRLIGGYTKSLPFADLQKVATALKISMQELMGGTGDDAETIATCNLVSGSRDPVWRKVDTDEMMPTFKRGDSILVDMAVKAINGAGIYLIGTPGGASAFRRASFNSITGKIRLETDNKIYGYSDEVEAGTVQILGRVIGIFMPI